jgi:hypothetical protein
MTESPNYCQHPECHNSHVAYYTDYYKTRVSGDARPWTPKGHRMSFHPFPGARRWCRSHALINEGVAYG